MDQPEKLWALKEFDANLPLVIMVTGWKTDFSESTDSALEVIYRAYRCRGGVNFVVSYFVFDFVNQRCRAIFINFVLRNLC